jgi:hypothetical protein
MHQLTKRCFGVWVRSLGRIFEYLDTFHFSYQKMTYSRLITVKSTSAAPSCPQWADAKLIAPSTTRDPALPPKLVPGECQCCLIYTGPTTNETGIWKMAFWQLGVQMMLCCKRKRHQHVRGAEKLSCLDRKRQGRRTT